MQGAATVASGDLNVSVQIERKVCGRQKGIAGKETNFEVSLNIKWWDSVVESRVEVIKRGVHTHSKYMQTAADIGATLEY